MSATSGGPLHDSVMRDGLYDAMNAAGIDRDRGTGKLFVCSTTSGTRSGWLAAQAFPLSDVQRYMGHAQIETTMLYVHHTPQHDAADKLSRLAAEAPANSVPALEALTSS